MERTSEKRSVTVAWGTLIFVVLLWGFSPLVTLYFYSYYSPTIRVALAALISAASLAALCGKKLRLLNKSYFLVAVPTGIFYTAANLLQKIGLQYTTPAHYAVLENLACVVVPLLLLVLIKKKPTALTMFAAALCLGSTIIITGFFDPSGAVSVRGDLLCALAGIFYGFNTAATGVFAKKFYVPLYLMIQMLTEMVISTVCAILFHVQGIEPIQFCWRWEIFLGHMAMVLCVSTFGWVLRTNAMKKVSPSVVAVIMPFSSVVTAVLSVLLGKDTFSWSLVIGVVLGVVAIILSGFGDRPKKAACEQSSG